MFKLGKIPNGLDLLNYFIGLTTKRWAAAGTVLVGALQARGARKAGQAAAGAQQAASEAALEEQRRQFDIAQAQAAPFREAGVEAIQQQRALLGLAGPEAQQQAMEGLQESPGQQFIRQRQQRALLRGQAAIGGLGGGNVRTALQAQAAGFAQQDLQNQFSRLGQLAGQGQATTAQLGQLGAGAAQRAGQFQLAGGQAAASGILGAQQAQGQLLGRLGGGLRGIGMAGQTPGVTPQQGFLAGFR